MHRIASRSIQRRFHNDFCTITELPRAGNLSYDEATFTSTLSPGSVHYEGPCNVDERSGFRRGEEGQAESIIQGAEIRIVGLPTTVAVGMKLVLERLPDEPFEIREISKGTNEGSRTLLVERTHQLPPVGAVV